MPPLSTPTTRGYFGSAFFNNGFFGSDHWKERVPVPVPPSAPSAGLPGGIGGGKTLTLEDLCDAYREHPVYEKALIDQLCKKVLVQKAKVKRAFSEPDPLSKPRKADPQKAREADVRRLNKRVRELEKELADAQAANPYALFDEAEAELEKLRELLTRLTALEVQYKLKLAELEAERARLAVQPTPAIAASPFPGVGVFANAAPAVDEPSLDERIAQALAEIFPQQPTAPPTTDKTGAWVCMAAAAAAALATYYLVPDKSPTFKTIGYATAASLATASVKELLA